MKKHIYCRHCSDYEVQFFDVDSMDIMWHGHYVKYLEMARCAFLTDINYTYDLMREQGYAWPIVQLNLKYVKPARFRQKIRVNLAVVEYQSCLRIEYDIIDIASGSRLTKGATTQVAVALDSGEMQLQTPRSWCKAVEAYAGFTPSDLP
ncbi:acyl-CoA thioesterase [Mesocricetibacter intestinalis]|uniref:acyl-CoA thioesterase n=1 Tax=Mesocricetibacter intestinalis TaxID=1521930 RepID=UPI001AACF801|nr:acyl-CoA thioesterase [Mesocricetibacter intestinalis]